MKYLLPFFAFLLFGFQEFSLIPQKQFKNILKMDTTTLAPEEILYNTYDCIIAYHSLEWAEDSKKLFTHLLEALEENGYFLLVVDPADSPLFQVIINTIQDDRLGWTLPWHPLKGQDYKTISLQRYYHTLYSNVQRRAFVYKNDEELRCDMDRFIPPFLPSYYHEVFKDIFMEYAQAHRIENTYIFLSKTLVLLIKSSSSD